MKIMFSSYYSSFFNFWKSYLHVIEMFLENWENNPHVFIENFFI